MGGAPSMLGEARGENRPVGGYAGGGASIYGNPMMNSLTSLPVNDSIYINIYLIIQI